MPTLRDRVEDLPLLIEELVERAANEQGVRFTLSPAALRCLSHYPWPGNVRELANLMERLAIMKPDGRADLDDLPAKFRAYYSDELAAAEAAASASNASLSASTADAIVPNEPVTTLPPDGLDLRQYIADLETSLIQTALEDANGVVTHAASLLKMRRTTLVEKMRKYSIRRDDDEA